MFKAITRILFKCAIIAMPVGSTLIGINGFSQQCEGPTAKKQAELSEYLVKRYHYSTSAKISLVESNRANDACYWKLHYKISNPTSDLTVFLSPDGLYLSPTLYDLRIDPVIEEKTRAALLARTLTEGDPPSLGSANAPITIVEFSDFQCPFCKRFTDVLEKDLTDEERKDIRIVFRQFPLSLHPWAKAAAEIAGCAALQDDASFWKLHDYLFTNQSTFTVQNLHDNLAAFAVTSAGLDKGQLDKCLNKKLAVGGVNQDMDMGTQSGVKVTPTIFINGTKYEGAKDAGQLRGLIEQARKAQDEELKASNPKIAAAN